MAGEFQKPGWSQWPSAFKQQQQKKKKKLFYYAFLLINVWISFNKNVEQKA